MEKMSKEDYLKLVNEINMHNYYYHVLDQPIISDSEFDKLILRIRIIEADHQDWITEKSPTQRVGAVPVSKFDKVNHPNPILSLANAFNENDLISWRDRILKLDARVASTAYVIEPKIDGLTVVLHYQNGHFIQGATRGNGEIGEDVSSNIRTIKSIPLNIPVKPSRFKVPEELVIRGEVYISLSDFEKLNEGCQVYRAVYNALQGLQNQAVVIDGHTYYILSAREEVQGQDLVDADIPNYFRVLTFFEVMIR